ncbi:MAG: M15 family metallopeptidase [Gemmatimonadetes bacterium]|nr:M15 family metallopeptidase [Gemmatimonadota bacterium]
MTTVGAETLAGQTEGHISAEARMHWSVESPFNRLRADAALAGFDLRVLSGFRGFSHQLSIWNRKARGELAVVDSDASPLSIVDLTEVEWVYAILRWSALPGASRHHWGTDLDVYDEAARPSDYEIDLTPQEVDAGGMFAPLHEWLDERIATGAAHGFFRPYDRDRGGVAPERWHLSHAPTAAEFDAALSLGTLRATLSQADLESKSVVLEHLDDIYARFVINTNRTTS